MSSSKNKAIVRHWNEEIWRGSETIYSEVIAPDCIFHWMGGPREIRETISRIRSVFPDIEVIIEDQFGVTDKVATRWRLYGTHLGELWSIPATKQQITYTGITINRLADDKIVEEWCEADLLGILEQIGGLANHRFPKS